jgi:hypothetical protein
MTAKRLERASFVALIGAALACLSIALFSANHSKWLSSASVLIGLAGVVQLEISGLFEHWVQRYGDTSKYPSGPPSHITRQLSDVGDPDRPVRAWLYNAVFFERRTGFHLIVLGGILQLFSIWV